MINIFISYRRKDSSADSRSLYLALKDEFFVFHDIDKEYSIPYGTQFPQQIKDGIKKSNIFLILIGKEFVNEVKHRSINKKEDWVLEEVLYAKKLNKDIIPILIDNTKMPLKSEFPDNIKFLTEIDSIVLSHEKFHQDIATLKRAIRKLVYKNLNKSENNSSSKKTKSYNLEKIEKLLRERNFKEASIETTNLLLKLTKREQFGWIREKDLEKIPCDLILSIESMWKKYSNGNFGFEAQLEVFEENELPIDKFIGFVNFSNLVSWCKDSNWIFEGNEDINGSFPLPLCKENNTNIKEIALRAVLKKYIKCKELL